MAYVPRGQEDGVAELAVDLFDELVRLNVETELGRIDGVEQVRVVPGANRPVDELHALVNPARSAKRVSRDMQTLLMTRYGIDVDHRVISIVQLGVDVRQALANGVPRLVLDGVTTTVRDTETRISVDLVDADDLPARGEVSVPSTGAGIPEAVARATVMALEEHLGINALHVAGAQMIDVAGHTTAVVVIEARIERTHSVLSGSAAVRLSESDAVARAVLDATNRLVREQA